MTKVEFFHKVVSPETVKRPANLPQIDAVYVVYCTNFGNVRSSSCWMVPGTYTE